MANQTPNLDELRRASGSDDIATMFKHLFNNEVMEAQARLVKLEAICRELGDVLAKREGTVRELHYLGPNHEKGVDALSCLVKMNVDDRDILQGLEASVDLIRDGIEQKQDGVTLMEIDEDMTGV